MTRKILVINPNTSLEMTADLKTSIEKHKLADTEYRLSTRRKVRKSSRPTWMSSSPR